VPPSQMVHIGWRTERRLQLLACPTSIQPNHPTVLVIGDSDAAAEAGIPDVAANRSPAPQTRTSAQTPQKELPFLLANPTNLSAPEFLSERMRDWRLVDVIFDEIERPKYASQVWIKDVAGGTHASGLRLASSMSDTKASPTAGCARQLAPSSRLMVDESLTPSRDRKHGYTRTKTQQQTPSRC